MIIWGSKARQKQIGSGKFYCPECRKQTPYTHIRLSRWFTLYFIPVFPTSTLAEAVCCTTCAGDFNPQILSMSAQQIENAIQPWMCAGCGNKNPRSEGTCLGCGLAPGAAPSPALLDGPPAGDNDERYKPKLLE